MTTVTHNHGLHMEALSHPNTCDEKSGLHWMLCRYTMKYLLLQGGERQREEIFISPTGCWHAMPEKKMAQISFSLFLNKVGNHLKMVYRCRYRTSNTESKLMTSNLNTTTRQIFTDWIISRKLHFVFLTESNVGNLLKVGMHIPRYLCRTSWHDKKLQFGEDCSTLLLVVYYLFLFMHFRKVHIDKKGSG